MNRFRIGLLVLSMLLPLAILAQRRVDENDHLWITYLGDHKVLDHWSLHTEAHWRRSDFGQTWQQLLIRPAINYHTPAATYTLGFSYYRNYDYGDFPIGFHNSEHHLYEQVALHQKLGERLTLNHRYRLEQRWIDVNVSDGEGGSRFDHLRYLNRFRYRVLATLPLSKPKLEAHTWFASAYDEVFLTFGDNARVDLIQQNRLSGLLGYQLDGRGSSVQLGYLWQTIGRPGAAPAGADVLEKNHTLHLIVTYNLDLRKRGEASNGRGRT